MKNRLGRFMEILLSALLLVAATTGVCAAASSRAPQAAPSATSEPAPKVQHYTEIAKYGGSDQVSGILVSADGSTVIAPNALGGFFVWNTATGMQNLASLGRDLSVHGISSDGKVVVGAYFDNKNHPHVYRWTQAEGAQDIGKLPPFSLKFGSLNAISAEGVVVTNFQFGITPAILHWTSGHGEQVMYQRHWKWGRATAISADGSIFVGRCASKKNGSCWFRWTKATHMEEMDSDFLPVGTTPDGETVYGTRGQHLVSWTQAGGLQEIADLGTPDVSVARVADDGSVAVGLAYDSENNRHVFRWTKAGGMEMLPGFDEKTVPAVSASADGQIIAATVLGNDGAVHQVVTPMSELQARAEEHQHKLEATKQAKAQADAQADAAAIQHDIELNNRIDKVLNGGHPSQIYALAGEMEDQNRPDLAEKLYQELIDQYPDDQWTAKAIDKKDRMREAAAQIAAQQQAQQQDAAAQQAAGNDPQAAANCRAQCKSAYDSCASQVRQQNSQAMGGMLAGLLTHDTAMAVTSAASSGSLSDCLDAQNSCTAACQ